MLASTSIESGHANVILVGGFESMSNVPHYLPHNRFKSNIKFGNKTLIDGLKKDGLTDAYGKHLAMGNCADILAKEMNISRQEQDNYSKISYQRAQEAVKKRLFF